MASFAYNDGKTAINSGDFVFTSATIKTLLINGTPPSINGPSMLSNVTGEVSSSGYTAGGATLAGKSVVSVDASNRSKFDADNITWIAVSLTATHALTYYSTGTASTSPLLFCHDFGGDKVRTAEDFVLAFHADGLAYT